MVLKLADYIDLPDHIGSGGFDHAAVHGASGRLYVAHTANDALDVIDGIQNCFAHSIPGLPGIAGALVSEEDNLIFTSNRGENTVSIFTVEHEQLQATIPVGVRPNGLAYDPNRKHLLSAHVGDPAVPGSFTVSIIDFETQSRLADIVVPGRTRWTIYDALTNAFYVNIADPAQIVVIDADDPSRISRTFAVPSAGPHGLDIDSAQGHLFCACDGKRLLALDVHSGEILSTADLSGTPDVIFFNPLLSHLYVAIGDPGVIDVFETKSLRRIGKVLTEKGAHTLAFDKQRQKVYAFLPKSHHAAVYLAGADQGDI